MKEKSSQRGFKPVANFFLQFRRAENIDVLAPGQNPRFDFEEGGELEGEFQAAPGEFLDFLAGVPDAFADELGGERVELQADGVAAFGGEDAEAVLEVLFDGETGGAFERRSACFCVLHPGEDEGAQGFPFQAEADDIPLVHHAGEVVGPKAAAFIFRGVEFPVGEGQFDAFADGFADRLKGGQIHGGDLEVLERHQGVEVVP